MARHIVIGVDGSAPATAAVEWAAADAQRRELSMRILHVCEQWPYRVDTTRYCAGTLAAAADRARALTRGVEVTTQLLSGNVVDTLIGESGSADSVVIGSRGLGGFAGMMVGSVSMGVAGHAAGPVVVVRETSVVVHGRVVVGYDGSEHSEAAMRYAVEQARAREVPLHVIYAWQAPVVSTYAAAYGSFLEDAYEQETETAQERVARWRDGNPDVAITDETVVGHPVNFLIEAGGTADLVVVGSRGLGGFASAVLGSVSHAVLHHLRCPVAVVRPGITARKDGQISTARNKGAGDG
ncbi:universal stress protein [Nonomuraea turcica]|uniref:universal stress protein n=1 Tax=Nonomuraea sp. G32 TaxID=3067274 RepID=UPI00273BB7D1|nr:universal stress protein [Nonomuraea sp. G32]MDP4507140.1 universal stress protein [Nonomuraea sp. G32]